MSCLPESMHQAVSYADLFTAVVRPGISESSLRVISVTPHAASGAAEACMQQSQNGRGKRPYPRKEWPAKGVDGLLAPVRIDMVVVFPAPLWPSSPVIWPL